MTNRSPEDRQARLLDSATMVRLVDGLLDEFRADESMDARPALAQVMDVMDDDDERWVVFPKLIIRAYREIVTAVDTLRRSRSALERQTLDRIQSTNEKLLEISSTTEIAATNMLDGLDRVLGFVDRLDALDAATRPRAAAEPTAADEADAPAIRAAMREEVFRLMACLQFQDITAQQIQYASAVLAELEQRLGVVADLFGIVLGPDSEPDMDTAPDEDTARAEPGRITTYDPAASMRDSDDRQALVDAIFATGDNPTPARP